jgi:tetratricopeptide (TPR) repeat protein
LIRWESPACLIVSLLLTLAPAAVVWAHPDLLAQIELLDEKLADSPGDAGMLLQRGDLYRRHADFDNASRDFDAARAADPGHPLLNFYQGQLAFEAGRADEAEQSLSVFLAANPEHAKAWRIRGQTSIRRGDPVLAARCFDSAIQTSSSPSPGLYRQKILAQVASSESAWPAALATVGEGLERFNAEINMLGLGVDIALASALPDQAQSYLDMLPDGLRRLPAWIERIQSLQCLTGSKAESPGACLQQSRERLAGLVEGFLAE